MVVGGGGGSSTVNMHCQSMYTLYLCMHIIPFYVFTCKFLAEKRKTELQIQKNDEWKAKWRGTEWKKKLNVYYWCIYAQHITLTRERILLVHRTPCIYIYIYLHICNVQLYVCINTVYVYQSVHDTKFSVWLQSNKNNTTEQSSSYSPFRPK